MTFCVGFFCILHACMIATVVLGVGHLHRSETSKLPLTAESKHYKKAKTFFGPFFSHALDSKGLFKKFVP